MLRYVFGLYLRYLSSILKIKIIMHSFTCSTKIYCLLKQLKINLYTIKYTDIKCTVWRIFTNSCSHGTSTSMILLSIISKQPVMFLCSQSMPLPHIPLLGKNWSGSCHCLIVLHSLEFHINEILQSLVFCIWFLLFNIMFLKFIMLYVPYINE